MKLSTHRSTTVVGLDIQAGSVAASEVTTNGSSALGKFGIAPLGSGMTREGEVTDPAALGELLKSLFAESKLSRNVRVGLASQRVIVRMMRLPLIEDRSELEAAIRFQAPEQIAMPLEQAVIDWQVLDPDPEAVASKQIDVVVVAARRETVTGMTQALHAANLRPVGIDVSAFAMIRALAPAIGDDDSGAAVSYEERMSRGDGVGGAVVPARLFCNLGDVTNLAVARGTSCLFTRVANFGIEGVAQRLAERRGLTLEHARQWLGHVGLETPLEELEGDPETVSATRRALEDGASKLAGELRLSLDYYGAQERAVVVEEVVVCGPGTAIAGLPQRLQRELGLSLRVGRPDALAHLDDDAATRLTLAYGLGLEG